ncbi:MULTISPECIES: transposase family protein [unclassified Streptomyces]|uniref:transposase family protein n=1 Tax=unclassified Streptomyces TaxID=2593676 RepID=UPI00365061FD
MRHRLAVVLALTACAVLVGATSPLAVGEWIADALGAVLEQVGARPDPLLPRRVLPAETTVRRLLARIDGDALDRAVRSLLRTRSPSPPRPQMIMSRASRDYAETLTVAHCWRYWRGDRP